MSVETNHGCPVHGTGADDKMSPVHPPHASHGHGRRQRKQARGRQRCADIDKGAGGESHAPPDEPGGDEGATYDDLAVVSLPRGFKLQGYGTLEA